MRPAVRGKDVSRGPMHVIPLLPPARRMMELQTPAGSRPGARVLLFGPSGSLLLLHASLSTRQDFWVCPGGGLESGETWELAAHREVMEETGLSITLGPLVWYRRHRFSDSGQDYDLFERYFVGHAESEEVQPTCQDGYIQGHRWWSVDEVLSADAEFTPRRLPELLPVIAQQDYPEKPFDCGV